MSRSILILVLLCAAAASTACGGGLNGDPAICSTDSIVDDVDDGTASGDEVPTLEY